MFDPHTINGLECYVYTDFAVSWDKSDSDNP